ncbi:hypothetical protein HAX54_008236, partial [Datura stramonium]|nr:hypothetical protein [Datura stramonium]
MVIPSTKALGTLYIRAIWGVGGRGVLLANIGHQEHDTCPTSVVQSPDELVQGLGVYFKPKDSKDQVDHYPKPAENYTISTGAKLGEPLDVNSWFQIKSLSDSTYKELSRPIIQEELFNTTHTKKKAKTSGADEWVEPQVEQTYAHHNRQPGLLAPSLAIDEVDRAAMFVMEEKITHLSGHLAMATERERLRDEQLAATTKKE